MITQAEKNLMQRAARQLEAEATKLEQVYGRNWAESKDTRRAKAEHDRLLRDGRDLRTLARKLGEPIRITTELSDPAR